MSACFFVQISGNIGSSWIKVSLLKHHALIIGVEQEYKNKMWFKVNADKVNGALYLFISKLSKTTDC